MIAPLATGQTSCYDLAGYEIPCKKSGQDGESKQGLPWPQPRFISEGRLVEDKLTGLYWTLDANLAEYPLTWSEALRFVAEMNRVRKYGYGDWRLPNRHELRSLICHQATRPALPSGHPFIHLFPGWYWTSTTAAISPAHAWYVHMQGGRMFYGGKDQSYLAWPVRGTSEVLPTTGQHRCYSSAGALVPCSGSGQDGEMRCGRPWPEPRFHDIGGGLLDSLTGLLWRLDADLTGRRVNWGEALESIDMLNRQEASNGPWRLPNINELESITSCVEHTPALPPGARFKNLRDAYWSSTSSTFEPDWAWALYLDKGAIGVGQKTGAYFHVWAVCSSSRLLG